MTQPDHRHFGTLHVGDAERYQTIQQALDTIPPDEKSTHNPGVTVVVSETYDSANETFPVTAYRKQFTLTGYEPSSARVVVPDGKTGFDISGVGNADYRNTWQIRDLRIEGGDPAIRAHNSVHARIENVVLRNPVGTGIHFVAGPDGEVSYSNKINRVRILWGGNGIVLSGAAACHDTTINQCTINNVDGVGVAMNGSSTTVRDSAIQKSGRVAIEVLGGNNPRIRDNYFEQNGRRIANGDLPSGFPTDIDVREATNLSVEGNYFFAFGTSRRALNLRNADTATLTSNRYRAYTATDGRFVAVHDGCTDVDLHQASHRGDHDDMRNFVAFDRGQRTRDGGVIRPTDLSEVSGRYLGDRGIDDGSNTPTGEPALAIWADDHWHYSVNTPTHG